MTKNKRGSSPLAGLTVAAILLASTAGYVSALSRMFQSPMLVTDEEPSGFLGDNSSDAPAAARQGQSATFQYLGRTTAAWLVNALPSYSSGRARELWYLSLDSSGDRRLSLDTFNASYAQNSGSSASIKMSQLGDTSLSPTFVGGRSSASIAPSAPLAGPSFTTTAQTGAWNTLRWNNSTDGPTYTSAFTSGNDVSFTATTGTTFSIAGMGAATNVGNVTVAPGVTVNFTSASSTYATGGLVQTIDVGSGGTFNLGGQAISTAAGTGFAKTGPGVLALAGGTYSGGFTLNAGTVVATGVNAMGGSATNTLTINGGTIAGSATRDFSAKYGGGITVGGDFQLGALTADISLSSSTANLTFSNAMNFGAATRTITIGANGAYILGGVISGASGTGLTVNALPTTTGVLRLNGTNTYNGPTTINGGTLEVSVLANGGLNSSLGSSSNAATNLVLNGGTLSYINNLAAGSTDRNITLGSNGGGLVASGTIPLGLTGAANAANGNFTISGNITPSGSTGSQTLTLSGSNGTNQGNGTLSGIISDGTGTNATAVVKSGTGKWTLSGGNTYTGATTINGGTLILDNAGSTTPRLAGTTNISANAGGTLLLSSSSGSSTDRINDNATMTLNGGTFNTGGLSEHGANNNTAGIGALTLQSSSTIDLGNGASILAFANSSSVTGWTGTLSIYNWSGTPITGNGTDQLYFGSDATGLTPAQLTQISFYSDSGTTFLGVGAWGTDLDGEVVPTAVPEPSTWVGAALALAAIGWTQRRRLRALL